MSERVVDEGQSWGFGHHRGPQRCRTLFGPVFSCNLPVPIRSGLKPATDYGWEGYAPHATLRRILAVRKDAPTRV